MMEFTKNDDRSVTLSGTRAGFTDLRDTLKTAWDDGDSLVIDLNTALEGDAQTFTVNVAADDVGELVEVLEDNGSAEVRELGAALQKMMDDHNEAAIREAEGGE